jgi:hypothetical protein
MTRTVVALLAAALVAGCESDDGGPASGSRAPGSGGGTVAPPPPDAGTEAGHGAHRARVTVPESAKDPPSATIALVSASDDRTLAEAAQPGGASGRTVRLAEPRLRGTAVAEDDDEGVARVRVSISERITCLADDGARYERRRIRYRPPPQIERIRSNPGARLPARLSRSLLISVGDGPCGRGAAPEEIHGELWGEAINGSGLEAVTPHIRFRHSVDG